MVTNNYLQVSETARRRIERIAARQALNEARLHVNQAQHALCIAIKRLERVLDGEYNRDEPLIDSDTLHTKGN